MKPKIGEVLAVACLLFLCGCGSGTGGGNPVTNPVPPENIAGDWNMTHVLTGTTCGVGIQVDKQILQIKQEGALVDVQKFNVCGTRQTPLTGSVDGSVVRLMFEADYPLQAGCTQHNSQSYELNVSPGVTTMNGQGRWQASYIPLGCGGAECVWTFSVGVTPCSIVSGCEYDPSRC